MAQDALDIVDRRHIVSFGSGNASKPEQPKIVAEPPKQPEPSQTVQSTTTIETPVVAKPEQHNGLPLANKKILIVEQERQLPENAKAREQMEAVPDIAETIKKRLLLHGANEQNIIRVTSSKDALDQLRTNEFDLLIMNDILDFKSNGTDENPNIEVKDTGGKLIEKAHNRLLGLKVIVTAAEGRQTQDRTTTLFEDVKEFFDKKHMYGSVVNVPRSTSHWYDTGLDAGIKELFPSINEGGEKPSVVPESKPELYDFATIQLDPNALDIQREASRVTFLISDVTDSAVARKIGYEVGKKLGVSESMLERLKDKKPFDGEYRLDGGDVCYEEAVLKDKDGKTEGVEVTVYLRDFASDEIWKRKLSDAVNAVFPSPTPASEGT